MQKNPVIPSDTAPETDALPAVSLHPTEQPNRGIDQALMQCVQRLAHECASLRHHLTQHRQAVTLLEARLAEIDHDFSMIQAIAGHCGFDTASLGNFLQADVPAPRRTKVRQKRLTVGSQSYGVPDAAGIRRVWRRHKEIVLDQVTQIITASGAMSVGKLQSLLATRMLDQEMGEPPSKTRLSQILSESENFESDRLTGWRLRTTPPSTSIEVMHAP